MSRAATDPAPQPAAPDDLAARWRGEFPILARTSYLVSHSLGAMPRAVPDRLRAFAEQWAARGVRAWAEGWWTSAVDAGDRIARLIGAAPRTVVMHPNVSTGLGSLLTAFDWPALGRRTKIVCSALEFPTVLYACEAQTRIGARFAAVPARAGDPRGLAFDLERFLDAIDGETALVVLSAVLFKTSERVDLAAVAARARERGARVCADLYQAAGTVPLDVAGLGLDFAVGGSVKWLCGGPGAGYLYDAPDVPDRFAPRLTGWAGAAAPFAFEAPPQRYAAGAARFLNGSPHVPGLVAAAAGHEILLEVGVEAVRRKSLRQTARLMALAEARGFAVRTPREPERRGGSVTIDVPGGLAVAAGRAARELLCDFRPGAGLRVSPHFYTSDEEIERAAAAIEEVAREAAAAGPGARGAETRY